MYNLILFIIGFVLGGVSIRYYFTWATRELLNQRDNKILELERINESIINKVCSNAEFGFTHHN